MSDTIVFVTPRYGPEFAEEAEATVRLLAEASHRAGVAVEVLTTCSNDLSVWNNAYQPGATQINRVSVQRFPTDVSVDIAAYRQVSAKAFADPRTVTYQDQQVFVCNSLHSQPLYDHLQEHAGHYRCCVVAPYLFGTTYRAAQIMRDRTIHIPCLHDEPFARWAIFHEMLEEARGLLFGTSVEERLARELGIFNSAVTIIDSEFPSHEDSWEVVAHKFQAAVDRFMAPRSLYQTLSQRGRRRALEFTEERYEERLRDVIDRATQPAAPASAYAALQASLRDLARTARPDYRIQSRLPIVGRLVAWLRRTMTSHLREPYLDPILAQQERFNLTIHEQVAEITQLVWRLAQQDNARVLRAQEARIAELQARIAQIEAQLAEPTVVSPGATDESEKNDRTPQPNR